MRFSRVEDRQEREEQEVDIYEGLSATTQQHHAEEWLHEPGSFADRPPAHRKCLSAAAVVLLVLTAIVIAVLFKLYASVFVEKEQLKNKLNNMADDHSRLQTAYDQLRRNTEELHCLEGWRWLQGSCYFTSAEMKNWSNSRDDCLSREADLVVINSKEEQEFVSQLRISTPSWIGLQSVKIEKSGTDGWKEVEWTWSWVDGSQWTYTAWATNKSTIAAIKSAVSMDQEGKWTHSDSSECKHWICEKPQKPLSV